MGYLTILKSASETLEIKKSSFICYAQRVGTEEEAKNFIKEIKNKHKDARHNVFAYTIGENMEIQRYSDDGEPQGTAGIPVLEVIKKKNIKDTAIVVTRYFGGILLGAGGLTRAYSNAASLGIDAAGIVEKVMGIPVCIEIPYDLLGKIQYYCERNEKYIEEVEYTDVVKINLFIEKTEFEDFHKAMMELCAGKSKISIGEENHFFKMKNRLYLNT
jgi:uncharacterized YigZ family protein